MKKYLSKFDSVAEATAFEGELVAPHVSYVENKPAFSGNLKLDSVLLICDKGSEILYFGTFYNCASLETITIPSTVEYIFERTFEGCYFTKDKFINNSSLDAEANNYWGATIVDSDTDGVLIKDGNVIGYRP